jgi:aspartate 1-decarboxylase
MIYNMFHGKIHRATVTQANLEYMGSITIDSTLMKMAGILAGERVQIVDNNNGNRLETYVIEGPADSGVICLNGAAARKVSVGDKVIIIAYAMMEREEAESLVPKVVMVDDKNRPLKDLGQEIHGTTTAEAMK